MTHNRDMSIWVFDSQCVLCECGVQYTLKHERAASIRFVAIQSTEGRALAATHGINADDPTSFLFIENGQVLEQSDAIIALSHHLAGPVRFVAFAKPLPKGLRDFAYRLVARNRYRLFGRKDTCIVPSAEARHRFSL